MTESFPLPTSEIHVWVCYLTARCNMSCSYCIQKETIVPGTRRTPWRSYRELSGREWVDALNAFPVRPEHPLILTGGEPTMHRDFIYIATHLEGYELDFTSNLSFDVDAFIRAMRDAKKTFATSFHTYHPEFMEPHVFLDRAEKLRDSGVIRAPVFSIVNLAPFPHFRNDEHDRNQQRFVELATRRGFPTQANEFRGHHMGSPFDRSVRRTMDCTSAWVDFAPNGDIYNCQYHLVEESDRFGNVTRIDDCRPLIPFGTFFSCSDFGWCDSCHENSGHGAFRDPATGQVFRRDAHDARVYLRWMEPAAIADVARRYWREGNPVEAKHALLVALGRDGDVKRDPSAWRDLGFLLFDGGERKKALAAFLHAIELGARDTDVVAAALEVARETGRTADVRRDLERVFPAAELDRVSEALGAVLMV